MMIVNGRTGFRMTRADRVPVMTQTALLLILLSGFCRGAEPIDIGSVSYTHLTLPTKA